MNCLICGRPEQTSRYCDECLKVLAINQSFKKLHMDILDKNEDCDFAKFFKKLGYKYSWDFSKFDGLYWHELYKDGKLCLQVDMSIPLESIIEEILSDKEEPTPFFIASTETEFPELRKTLKDWKQSLN